MNIRLLHDNCIIPYFILSFFVGHECLYWLQYGFAERGPDIYIQNQEKHKPTGSISSSSHARPQATQKTKENNVQFKA